MMVAKPSKDRHRVGVSQGQTQPPLVSFDVGMLLRNRIHIAISGDHRKRSVLLDGVGVYDLTAFVSGLVK